VSRRFPADVQRQVDEGVRVLRRGGIVAYPTDTVYGLGASMSISGAVERVFAGKRRPRDMALPLLVADTSQVARLASQVPPVARRLMDSFMPGALTLVMPASPAVPGIVTAGGSTVAVRIPDHPIPIVLIESIGAPLVGTSANRSGHPSPLTAAEVRAQFGDDIDAVIDDGHPCPGTESTIVDVTAEIPVILREGAVSAEALRGVCGDVLSNRADHS
jgi:L-threonylcarbamoyladenylate synthase